MGVSVGRAVWTGARGNLGVGPESGPRTGLRLVAGVKSGGPCTTFPACRHHETSCIKLSTVCTSSYGIATSSPPEGHHLKITNSSIGENPHTAIGV